MLPSSWACTLKVCRLPPSASLMYVPRLATARKQTGSAARATCATSQRYPRDEGSYTNGAAAPYLPTMRGPTSFAPQPTFISNRFSPTGPARQAVCLPACLPTCLSSSGEESLTTIGTKKWRTYYPCTLELTAPCRTLAPQRKPELSRTAAWFQRGTRALPKSLPAAFPPTNPSFKKIKSVYHDRINVSKRELPKPSTNHERIKARGRCSPTHHAPWLNMPQRFTKPRRRDDDVTFKAFSSKS